MSSKPQLMKIVFAVKPESFNEMRRTYTHKTALVLRTASVSCLDRKSRA